MGATSQPLGFPAPLACRSLRSAPLLVFRLPSKEWTSAKANGERELGLHFLQSAARQRDRPCSQADYPQHPRDSLRFKRLSRPHLRRSTAPCPIVAGLLQPAPLATGFFSLSVTSQAARCRVRSGRTMHVWLSGNRVFKTERCASREITVSLSWLRWYTRATLRAFRQVFFARRRYSMRKASVGEMEAARFAGIMAARNELIARATAATLSAKGSQLETP